MQVIFESREPWSEPLRELAVRRIRLAIRHLKWLAPRAKVNMSDVEGQRDGIAKRCQVELTADDAGSVVITSIASDWRSALQSALSRAVKALLRKLPTRKEPAPGQPAITHDH